jgi:hypothetical protein
MVRHQDRPDDGRLALGGNAPDYSSYMALLPEQNKVVLLVNRPLRTALHPDGVVDGLAPAPGQEPPPIRQLPAVGHARP